MKYLHWFMHKVIKKEIYVNKETINVTDTVKGLQKKERYTSKETKSGKDKERKTKRKIKV